MNKTITDGVVFMPPPFVDGLAVWSSEDGTPGSATYDGAANAAFVPADSDFAGCLELQKTQTLQKLRWMGQTPIEPGCYLRITARVKAISGAFPEVRIAGWAGRADGTHAAGYIEVGPSVLLDTYGEVVEISAIVGQGNRGGVDMVWGQDVTYGHFGLDLTGSNGGVVRIDDIVIEDITDAFLRKMMDWVDVRDYGAVGDGVTDDKAAFDAADAAANGRTVLVSAGTYYIGSNTTIDSPVRFEGTLVMPTSARLSLIRNFNLPTYIDAFGNEALAFRKAVQALFNYTDHDTLDLGGRRIDVDGPIDIQAAVDNISTFQIRRVIRNGQFFVSDSPNWDPDVVTSSGSYNPLNPFQLTNVSNIAQIVPGMLIEGAGVGREVYVKDVNVGAGSLTLSQGLYGPAATQNYTFTRYKYVLDFSGFSTLTHFAIEGVELQMNGFANGILLAQSGLNFQLRNCNFNKPKHRGITSHGTGCQGLNIDGCQILSSESATPAPQRVSVGFNVNANDAKIRDSRFQRLGTTGVLHGGGHLIVGNHWFQGDEVTDGPRVAGMVFTQENISSIITGNYIDNCWIEWTNEHDPTPDFGTEYSFGGLTITGNIFFAIDVASYFNFIVVKPYGTGHFINGLHVNENAFKVIQGNIDRVDAVDSSIAGLDYWRMRNVTFERNTFTGINQRALCPATLEFSQNTDATTWTLDPSAYLPFGGNARTVTAVVAQGEIRNAANATVSALPYSVVNAGASNKYVQLVWPEPCRGSVQVTVRVDKPI